MAAGASKIVPTLPLTDKLCAHRGRSPVDLALSTVRLWPTRIQLPGESSAVKCGPLASLATRLLHTRRAQHLGFATNTAQVPAERRCAARAGDMWVTFRTTANMKGDTFVQKKYPQTPKIWLT